MNKKHKRKLIESHRKELFKDLDISMQNQYPGTFGCHEALHTVYVMMDTFERQVQEHPAIIRNKKWYRKADKISTKMYNLYSSIGRKHL